MNSDEFIETLRRDFAENQRKYNARNPILKLWDKIKLRLFYWGFIDRL